MRLIGILASIVIAGSSVLAAQQPLVFRSENNYVEVDAIVTDRQGNFVTGLSSADFQVSEIGRPQAIATFSYVNLPTSRNARSQDVIGDTRVRPDLPLTGAALSGRIYLLFLDSSWSTSDGLWVLRCARQFVTDYMLPSDVAAVWDSRYLNRELTFTNDRSALLRAIESAPTLEAMFPSDRGERSQMASTRFRSAVDWMSAIQGRRKSLILFTDGQLAGGGFRPPKDPRMSAEDWLRSGTIYGDAFGTWLTPTEFAGRSDVHVYPVDARGLVALPPPARNDALSPRFVDPTGMTSPWQDLSNTLWTLRMLADQTGGHAIINTNDYREGFQNIVTDNSRYYLLGYDSPQKNRDGRFIQISVKSTRPDVTVRAREGYIAR